LEFGVLVFVEGEIRRTWRKTLGARGEPTVNSIHIWHHPGIEPEPHWWKEDSKKQPFC